MTVRRTEPDQPDQERSVNFRINPILNVSTLEAEID